MESSTTQIPFTGYTLRMHDRDTTRHDWITRLTRVTYVVPPLVLAGLELVRQSFDLSFSNHRGWYLSLLAVALLGMLAFARAVSRAVNDMYSRLRHQNQELLALHEASLAVASDLRLNGVLQRVVNEAAILIGARYGAISYAQSLPHVDIFVTYGISEELKQKIGAPPVGRGVLGIPISSGTSLRIEEISEDPHSVGFPPNHPPMHRLLAVPISTPNGIVGNLYLSDRLDGEPFSQTDEDSLRRFAALAGIAIDNAVLHNQVEVLAITGERDRIAREMHDSLSQVLAYVNTKSQAALTWLKRGDVAAATEQIDQLAAAAREAYVDVREGIFALRTSTNLDQNRSVIDVLGDYLTQWTEQHKVPVRYEHEPIDDLGQISPLAEVHLLRLVQEALSNIRKHAHASTVSIEIGRHGVEWVIVIADDGIGFDPTALIPGAFPRFGLSTMRERAEASGGSFDLVSTPEAGTTITVTLPTKIYPT